MEFSRRLFVPPQWVCAGRWAAAFALIVGGMLLTAEGASVHFDVPQLVSCRPVVDCDNRPEAQEQRVEAVFEVSTLLRFGQEAQVKQLLFVIENPTGTLHVVDYLPRTALTSSYVGPIERTRQQEASRNAGFSASFSPTEFLSAQANSANSAKTSESVRFEALPPLQLLAASGTAARGSAVYFKFKSTSQSTLDGSRPLRVVFRVPAGWRADYVYVRCVAFAEPAFEKDAGICASHDFLVPLYRDGDEAAKQAASQLAEREFQLRQLARQSHSQLERSRNNSWSTKLTGIFHQDQPPVPSLWLTTVLSSLPSRREFSFESQLPEELRHAVAQFTDARWQLSQMNR
jgi:hypothetical protein